MTENIQEGKYKGMLPDEVSAAKTIKHLLLGRHFSAAVVEELIRFLKVHEIPQ